MFDLSGKAALVTGASGGIGGAIARALHKQGASVTLSGTRTDALEQLKSSLGERAHAISARMDDPADIDRLAKEAEAAMGKLDILVNNAGITRDNIATPMTDALTDDQKKAILARVPADRLGTADEIAAGVVYLASDEAAYVTGQTLHINGGMAMI